MRKLVELEEEEEEEGDNISLTRKKKIVDGLKSAEIQALEVMDSLKSGVFEAPILLNKLSQKMWILQKLLMLMEQV